jgi:CSLREA domain-containing protein
MLYETAVTSKAIRLRRSAARKARVALATALVAAASVVPPLVAGLVAPPAHASTTFVVNSTGDQADASSADGLCDVSPSISGKQCTLRAAIQQANATTGADTIEFNISGTGVRTIFPLAPLPVIEDQLTIDGFSQAGSSPNTLSRGTNAKLMIQLDGSKVSGVTASDGLRINASDVVVQGLVISRFSAVGGGSGIAAFSGASFVRLEQNFIGTDPTGTQDLGNASGVFDAGVANTIGGLRPDDANVISGNDGPGVEVLGSASNTQVVHNLIGTDKSGTRKLGNLQEGLKLAGSSATDVENNTIAFNGKDGVQVSDAANSQFHVTQDFIRSNSMFSNGGLGVDLVGGVEDASGATANDAGDTDEGPNGLQNKPAITSAKTISGKTTIRGRLNSLAGQTYTVELFSNPAGGNEGKQLIGQKSVTTGADGKGTFTYTPATAVSVGRTITATATFNATLETSEFSAPRTVASS